MVVEVGNKALGTGMVRVMGVSLGRNERNRRWKEEKEERGEKVMGRKGAWESGDYSGSSRVQILLHESEEAWRKME